MSNLPTDEQSELNKARMRAAVKRIEAIHKQDAESKAKILSNVPAETIIPPKLSKDIMIWREVDEIVASIKDGYAHLVDGSEYRYIYKTETIKGGFYHVTYNGELQSLVSVKKGELLRLIKLFSKNQVSKIDLKPNPSLNEEPSNDNTK